MSFGRKGVVAAAAAERSSPVCKFRLNSRKGRIVLALGLFGGGGLMFGSKAMTNDRGLIINHLIELGPTAASVFYAVLAVVSLLFVGAALVALVRQFGEPQWLVLDQHAVSGPQSVIINRQVRIPYVDLVGIKVTSVRNSSGVELRGRHGQKIWLSNADFEADGDLGTLLAELDRPIAATDA